MTHRDISKEQAAAVLQILKDECGYGGPSHEDESFIEFVQVLRSRGQPRCDEYRFIGALGFGGKFRNNGNHANTPHVDCYPEDLTAERREMIDRANRRLAELFGASK